ncbi:uncharacterized protein C10orf143 homolog isoform X1 [Manis pentadactyla]|uniref:uncharacterized protein C10orf143 homolog isoform X1 n=1 Tax=Manis pentadactyla TaxID=143292 RepID=UPI00255C9D1A|nr:uncharacterized protein C10orf143 homolog isoform X1 [Manis pentadactyla]
MSLERRLSCSRDFKAQWLKRGEVCLSCAGLWRAQLEVAILPDCYQKRACRRLQAATQEWGRPQVKVGAPGPWSREELEAQPRGAPESLQGRPSVGIPLNSGRNLAQPCLRCIAGESREEEAWCRHRGIMGTHPGMLRILGAAEQRVPLLASGV